MVKSFKDVVSEDKDIERLPDGRLNGRDAAMKGIHTLSKKHVAKHGHPKVGADYDFYSKTNGDKTYGKVAAYDGKHITFQAAKNGTFSGAKHKYKVHWED